MMPGDSLSVSVLRHPVHFLAMGFGSGLLPKLPGTWGTLLAVLVFCIFMASPLADYFHWLVAVFGFAGIWLCGCSAALLGVHDHPAIVWDEMAGYLLTMLWLPVSIATVLGGFLLFRLLDIFKPWPIGWVDRKMGGGLGIMMDDLLAAVVANLILQAMVYGKIPPFA